MAQIWLFSASARALDTFRRMALRMPQRRVSIWLATPRNAVIPVLRAAWIHTFYAFGDCFW